MGAKLRPDLVRLRRDMDCQWKKVVVDAKVTSTDKMNKAFKQGLPKTEKIGHFIYINTGANCPIENRNSVVFNNSHRF